MATALRWFERTVNLAILILLAIVVALATTEMFVLLFRRAGLVFRPEVTAVEFQDLLRRTFGSVLMVILGLELIETVRAHAVEHRVRLEIIFIVAMIALARHAIQIDLEHTDGMQLVGAGALMASLAGGYWLIKRSGTSASPAHEGQG